MNCDRLAPFYRAFELAAFETRLERHRFHFLDRVRESRRALLLGEGDGRFLRQLLDADSQVAIDYVDLSAGMLARAQSRLSDQELRRVQFKRADALSLRALPGSYDLVVTNFLFDCFHDEGVAALVRSVRSACAARAQWLVTEFQQPEHGWPSLHAAAWLTAMYVFFRMTTGLRTKRLPNHREALRRSGFELADSHQSMSSFVVSELWNLPL